MYKILRIICCVISALLLAACVFIFVYLGTVWGIACLIGAAAFFALTILFKNLQEDEQIKKGLQDSAANKESADSNGEAAVPAEENYDSVEKEELLPPANGEQ